VRFGREIFVERDDFAESPSKKFFRLSPGREVRLRYAYFITCRDVVKNAAGEVTELRCTYDPATRGGTAPPDGRKVKATLHWVAAADAVPAEIRLVNQLFLSANPDTADVFADLNPDSLEVLTNAMVEPAAGEASGDEPMQFERQGYFRRDGSSSSGAPIFVRTVGLRDTFAKTLAEGSSKGPQVRGGRLSLQD
jgi:glutaminyl-tRNA synthetase